MSEEPQKVSLTEEDWAMLVLDVIYQIAWNTLNESQEGDKKATVIWLTDKYEKIAKMIKEEGLKSEEVRAAWDSL